jgi:RNA-directed DNA polymerase
LGAALSAVVRNKGAPGVDGITVKQLPDILKARWPGIEEQLLQGRYQPQPVRRVKIPKPDGGTRNPGIPTHPANCTLIQSSVGIC